MEIKKSCVFFSRFLLTDQAGGGCRRESQIAEALAPLDFEFISWLQYPRRKTDRLRKILAVGKDYGCWADDFKDSIYYLRDFARQWVPRLHAGIKLAIVDEPIFFAPLIKKINALEIPLITLCQNLESLSFSQIKPAKQFSVFKHELQLYQLADLIVTISREETVLLNNFNLNTFYLPYYPVTSIAQRLLTIREKRQKTRKKDLLILGTFNNNATRDGAIEFITSWKNSLSPSIPHTLLVAGYGAERLQDVVEHDSIEFLGTLSDAHHDELLCTIEAVVSYQRYGAGALTKHTEMLLAGVPVLANSHAARSYYDQAGIIEFASVADFVTAYAKVAQWQGQIPLPLQPDTSQFIKCIQEFRK